MIFFNLAVWFSKRIIGKKRLYFGDKTGHKFKEEIL